MAESGHTLIHQIPFPPELSRSQGPASPTPGSASRSAARPAGFQLWTEARPRGAPAHWSEGEEGGRRERRAERGQGHPAAGREESLS